MSGSSFARAGKWRECDLVAQELVELENAKSQNPNPKEQSPEEENSQSLIANGQLLTEEVAVDTAGDSSPAAQKDNGVSERLEHGDEDAEEGRYAAADAGGDVATDGGPQEIAGPRYCASGFNPADAGRIIATDGEHPEFAVQRSSASGEKAPLGPEEQEMWDLLRARLKEKLVNG